MDAPKRRESVEFVLPVPEEKPEVKPATKKPVRSKPKAEAKTAVPAMTKPASKPVIAAKQMVKPTQTAPKQDEYYNISVGIAVTHKKFGKGTVTKLDRKSGIITVAFETGEKMLGFPSAFKMGVLTM